MAVSPSPAVTLTTKPENPESENSLLQPPDPSLPPPSTSTPSPSPSLLVENANPNPAPALTPAPTPAPTTTPPPPSLPSFPSFTPAAIPPTAPSFRPITSFAPTTPQFTPVPNPNFPNPNYQNPMIQPPGVNSAPMMAPGSAAAPGAVTVSVPPLRPGMYQMPPGHPPNPYQQMPNGYSTMPQPGSIPPPGIPRYPTTYTPMVRPPFPPRPPGPIGMLQPMVRPPVPGIRGVPPVAAAIVRPILPIQAPTEKPQTTVYVGKIASTVENDFILSLLRLCGPVKSWKRAQDPSNGTPRGFGFCEFESAEGVLRALRLLSKFSVDGQQLVLNVNQATREYLERYVEKKTEREKLKEIEAEAAKKEEESAPGVEKNEPSKSSIEGSKDEADKKETEDSSQNFGIVTDEDRESDREALEKLQNMLAERLKSKPLPPPPSQPPPDVLHVNSEAPTRSREDSDVDIMRTGDDKNDDEITSESKLSSEQDQPGTSSPDRNRRYDRSRDKERDLKREKERELERFERERERERVRRERERDKKIREAERLYRERLKEWEAREKEKAHHRQLEKDREKDRERERRREIMEQEDESDDDDRRKRRRSSILEDKKKRRKREKEDDLADRLREEEEIAEAKKREIEEQKQRLEQQKKDEEAKRESAKLNETENPGMKDTEYRSNGVQQSHENDSSLVNQSDDVVMKDAVEDESTMAAPDTKQNNNAPTRKLGFGLVNSGKRTAVPSVFYEEDEDDEDKDKKMRPLVPIDYSTEELQAVQTPNSSTPPSNLAAAAEFAKRISKEERSDSERDRSRRSSHRDRDRNDEDRHRSRDDHKTQGNKKLLDAKQLIDMIPKTKEELFSYEINWTVYDKHELCERMRPWVEKKITEFLGEPENTLVEYIVGKTKEHVQASKMLELLQAILDDEAEMFVLKMWRMLIFEIKKVETGLAMKPKA